MTWKDQWHSHRAQAVIFDPRRKFYRQQADQFGRNGYTLQAQQDRALSREYRDKAIQERARAAEIKALYLTKSPPEQQP